MHRLIGFTFLILLIACGQAPDSSNSNGEKETIKIACAANMQYAMDSIVVLFNDVHEISCEITSGSSGMLTSQIENGAPYDIFVSANMTYPETIHKNGNGEEPKIYAQGRLVLAVEKGHGFANAEAVLMSDKIERIALADEKTAPYGMAASQYIAALGNKVSEDKLVVGESIGQVNQYITTAAVNAAFTSYSFKVKNESAYDYYEIDADYFDPIDQGAMILNHGSSNHPEEAQKFLDFLISSDKCKSVLEYFGYLTN